MTQLSSDQLEEARAALYSPVIGDILDQIGLYHRILPPTIAPLLPDMVFLGRAMPVVMADVYGPQKRPFGLLTQALDDLRPGEVYVAAGGAGRCAYWGELLTATARQRGAVAAVVAGPHRDTRQVLAQHWPVFSTGAFAQDSSVRTAVIDYRCPVEISGVWIEPGDLMFGDHDGVCVIPQAREVEVVERALEKVRGEKRVRAAIEQGMSATEAFARFGIL